MWLIFILSTLALVQSQEWQCGGDFSYSPEVPKEGRHLLSRSSTLAPMRVKFFYDKIDLGDPALTTQLTDVVMPAVASFLKTSLKVYPIQNNLVLYSGECILGLIIPTDHTTIGVENVDLVIYASVENDPAASYVARAGYCRTDYSGLGNPTAGGTMINIAYFNSLSVGSAIATMTHEITHVLGFSGYAFSYWRNKSGALYSVNTLTKTETMRGVTKTIMVSDTVLEKAREAFGCSTIKGIEIEEYGGSGTAGSHWDKRIMMNDYMTGYVPAEPVWTTITLAALQDSGWYTADYTLATTPTFGVPQGCAFFDSKCVVNGVSSNSETWVDKYDEITCDVFALNKGYGSVSTYSGDLPAGYQYFTAKTSGGDDAYADYCPYRKSYSNGNCRDKPFIWDYKTNEVAGPKSRCFDSTLSTAYNIGEYSACYEVIACSDTAATVKIGTQTISCPFTGATLTVPGYYGTIKCPKSKILCDNVSCPSMCYARGKCVKGECICLDGFGGLDCSIACSKGCKTCDSTGCLSCLTAGTTPVSGKCSSCSSNCLTCPTSDTVCETCASGYTVTNGACVALCSTNCASCNADGCITCKAGFFVNSSKGCDACSTNCKVCTSTACTECLVNYKVVSGKCEFDCGANCATCKDATTCSICATGYKAVTGKCEFDCGANCATCKDTTTCSICATGYKVVTGKCQFDCGAGCTTCKDTTTCSICADGYYIGSGKCIQCTTPCSKCTSGTLCTLCPSTHNLVSGKCVLICPTGCSGCTSSTTCSGCSTGYSLVSSSCIKCPTNCSLCTSTTSCSTCLTGYKAVNGACQIQCSSNCLSCTSSSSCTTCNSGYFVTSAKACSLCTSPCKTCSGAATTCTGCNTDYTLSASKCIATCSSNCKSCSLPNTCTTCNSGYYVSSSKCIKCLANCSLCTSGTSCGTCATGYRVSGSSCAICPKTNCATCSSTACLTCKSGFTLKSGSCA